MDRTDRHSHKRSSDSQSMTRQHRDSSKKGQESRRTRRKTHDIVELRAFCPTTRPSVRPPAHLSTCPQNAPVLTPLSSSTSTSTSTSSGLCVLLYCIYWCTIQDTTRSSACGFMLRSPSVWCWHNRDPGMHNQQSHIRILHQHKHNLELDKES